MGLRVTKEEIQKQKFSNAIGKLRVLAIGISKYDNSFFPPLNKCVHDAEAVKTKILNTAEQLNTDETKILELNSNGSVHPSKGEILKSIRHLAETAENTDRIMLYYSGHGHRIDDQIDYFLVPQDVYSNSKPEALINFDEVVSIMQSSLAKVKLIVLDACFSGPATLSKGLVQKTSNKAFADYVKTVKGLIVISSSEGDQASTTKSPSNLSLFTHYFVEALAGNEDALDEGRLLTVASLFKYVSFKVSEKSKSYGCLQNPAINLQTSGMVIIGDFRQLLQPSNTSTGAITPCKRLVGNAMQMWKEFDLLPDVETLFSLDKVWDEEGLSPMEMAFIYSTSFFRLHDIESQTSRHTTPLCFDYLFYPLKVEANCELPVLHDIVIEKAIRIEEGNAIWCITYPKFLISKLIISDGAQSSDALYCLIRDSEGEGIDVLITKNDGFTTLIRHIQSDAGREAAGSCKLLQAHEEYKEY